MAEESQELDLVKVQDFIKGQVQTFAEQLFAQRDAQQRQQVQPVTTVTPEQQARQQLYDAVMPIVKPELDSIKMGSADAIDRIAFYNDPSNDIDDEEKETIEEMFKTLKENGRPLPRSDIRDFLRGKLARENPKKYEEKTKARRERQAAEAVGATDVGFGALDRARNDPVYARESFEKLSIEDMEKALEGIAF